MICSLPIGQSESDPDSDQEEFPSSDDADDSFDAEEFARLAGTTPIRRFRTIPNPTYLNPFILAFANFVKYTASPFLLSAILTTDPMIADHIGHSQFEICYYAPNQRACIVDETVEDQKVPRIVF